MKDWFYKFMQGRNGINHFSRFLSTLGMVLLIISLFLKQNTFGNFILLFGFACVFYSNYIIFSRNKVQRAKENQDYLALRRKFLGFFGRKKNKMKNLKDYKYLKCPNCKTEMRVPRGKGKIKVHCKNCDHDFITKS